MARLIKGVRMKNKMSKHLNDILKISKGVERVTVMLVSFTLLQHIAACLWIFIGRFDDQSKLNWIYIKSQADEPDSELYVTSFYFTVTTILTVGYGDIAAYSMIERIYCVILMLIGVFSFSFATGSLASIISSMDVKSVQLQ
jgi:hypothetical protein